MLKPSSSSSNRKNNCLEITSLSDVEALLKKFDLLEFQHRTNMLLQGWESTFLKKPKLLQIYPVCSRKDIDDEVEVVYDNNSGSEHCTDQSSEESSEWTNSESSKYSEDNFDYKRVQKRRKRNPVKKRYAKPHNYAPEEIPMKNSDLVNKTPENEDVSEISQKYRSKMGTKKSSSFDRGINVEATSARSQPSGVIPRGSEQSMDKNFFRETNGFDTNSNSNCAATNIIDVEDDQTSPSHVGQADVRNSGINRTSLSTSLSSRKKRFFSEEEKRTLAAGVKEYGEGRWTQILDSHPDIFVQRTNVNLKDLYRTMKRNGVRF